MLKIGALFRITNIMILNVWENSKTGKYAGQIGYNDFFIVLGVREHCETSKVYSRYVILTLNGIFKTSSYWLEDLKLEQYAYHELR